MAMTSWSPLLVLLLASSFANAGQYKLYQIQVYMHERLVEPNATLLMSVQSPLGCDVTFGQFGVVDNELRDGPDRRYSSLIGRFQGMFALAGLVSPPGMQSAINFVFTAGKYRGSTLAMLGPVLDYNSPIERSIVGGTGKFRMASGYSIMTAVTTTPEYEVYQLDLFVKVTPFWELPSVDSVSA